MGRPRKILPETGKPWDKHPTEHTRHYMWFLKYRDMWPRSLAGCAKLVGKSSVTIEKLSSRWDWTDRCAHWDQQMLIQVNRKVEELADNAIAAMKERHIQLGLGMQTAAGKELQAWVYKIEQAAAKAKEEAVKKGLDPSKVHHKPVLKISELIRLAQEGTNMERLNRGEPTEITRNEQEDHGLEKLTVKELRDLKKLKQKLKG